MMNESALDRAFRILLGIALVSLVLVGPKTRLGFLGAVPLLTGTLGFCPLYRLLGIRTRGLHPAHA